MTVARYIRIIFRSFVDFFRDGGLMLAGSLSYFFMMAIIPFCLFLIAIFGYFLGVRQEFYQFFLSKLMSFFPKITSGITEELGKIITHKGIGKLTLILYGFLSYQLFSSLEYAINTIFRVKARRSFIISLVLSLFMVTLIIAFVLASFGATSAILMLKTLKEFFPDIRVGRATGFLISFVIPLILGFMIVSTIYKLFPKKKVKIAHAMAGAFFTAIFLEAAKHLFTVYVVRVVDLGSIYGSLSAFVIFLLWVFYSSCIVLIGAEVVKNAGNMKG